MILISDFVFQGDGDERTWIRYLPLPARWKSELVNTNKLQSLDVTVRRHLYDVYSPKFRILRAWYTVMQTICKRHVKGNIYEIGT